MTIIPVACLSWGGTRRSARRFFRGGGRHEGLSEVRLGWRQDIGNWSNQESKFDFLATRQCLVKIKVASSQ